MMMTINITIRGMKGHHLRSRVETEILPALKECLACEPLDAVAIPLGVFNALVEHSGMCSVSKTVDSDNKVESALLLGRAHAREQLSRDLGLVL
ncbi:Hypothetical protein, putative [Bodo saltans]|uniref:Uncharacterized protein n=1 Tax=Bodo saltans TaxID=75058 RepID=A0A0S4J3A8_BODSA|nr:Hypothetical protein, putative [Bodo saltans]|eukprot:CUG85559.1 Hypothetical protein, putative [Bodo saltans]